MHPDSESFSRSGLLRFRITNDVLYLACNLLSPSDFQCNFMGNDEKSVNGIIINSGIVGSATEKWDQDLQ